MRETLNPYQSTTLSPAEALPPLPFTEAEARLRLDRAATRLAMAAVWPPLANYAVIVTFESQLTHLGIAILVASLLWDAACAPVIWLATDCILRQRWLRISRIALWAAVTPGIHLFITGPLALPLIWQLRDPRIVPLFAPRPQGEVPQR